MSTSIRVTTTNAAVDASGSETSRYSSQSHVRPGSCIDETLTTIDIALDASHLLSALAALEEAEQTIPIDASPPPMPRLNPSLPYQSNKICHRNSSAIVIATDQRGSQILTPRTPYLNIASSLRSSKSVRSSLRHETLIAAFSRAQAQGHQIRTDSLDPLANAHSKLKSTSKSKSNRCLPLCSISCMPSSHHNKKNNNTNDKPTTTTTPPPSSRFQHTRSTLRWKTECLTRRLALLTSTLTTHLPTPLSSPLRKPHSPTPKRRPSLLRPHPATSLCPSNPSTPALLPSRPSTPSPTAFQFPPFVPPVRPPLQLPSLSPAAASPPPSQPPPVHRRIEKDAAAERARYFAQTVERRRRRGTELERPGTRAEARRFAEEMCRGLGGEVGRVRAFTAGERERERERGDGADGRGRWGGCWGRGEGD